MARKRGGLAGVWDRNKKVIKPIAEIGASLLGGPMASAGVGALMEGLDRPGKSGIGFDVGAGLRGGATGYGVGQGTQLAKGGVKALMSQLGTGAAPGASAGAGAVPKYNLTGGVGDNVLPPKPLVGVGAPVGVDMPPLNPPAFTPSGAGLRANPIPSGVGKQTGYSLMDRLGRGVEWAQKNDKVAELALKGISSALPNQETSALIEKNRIAQRQYELEQRQYEDEQRRKQQMAQLLMPLYQQMMATGKYGTPTTTP